mgnify:CR=1 FL=1
MVLSGEDVCQEEGEREERRKCEQTREERESKWQFDSTLGVCIHWWTLGSLQSTPPIHSYSYNSMRHHTSSVVYVHVPRFQRYKPTVDH